MWITCPYCGFDGPVNGFSETTDATIRCPVCGVVSYAPFANGTDTTAVEHGNSNGYEDMRSGWLS